MVKGEGVSGDLEYDIFFKYIEKKQNFKVCLWAVSDFYLVRRK